MGLRKLKLVSIITGLGFVFISDSFKARLGRFLYYIFLRFSDKVWFLNYDDLKAFLEKKLIVPEKAIVIPGEGIELEKFQSALAPKNKPRKILYAGRLLVDKGVLHLIEAVKTLNQNSRIIDLVMIGPTWFENPSSLTPNQVEDLKQEKLVSYLGPQNNVIPFMQEADAICLPSYREGVPVTLLEGAAVGRVLLATDVPGCRDVVVPGVNGFLCKAQSTEAIIQMLKEFLKLSDEQIEKMSLASRNFVEEKFSYDKVIRYYDDFIKED
jgi:glycosyltransferase involved in cell wall biosynthesis